MRIYVTRLTSLFLCGVLLVILLPGAALAVDGQTDAVRRTWASSYWGSEYRVVGNTPWMGDGASASDEGRMIETEPGVYVKTFEEVDPGDYEFHITKNGSWEGTYNAPPYRFTVSRPSNVTVTLTLENSGASVDVSLTDWNPRGDMNGDGKVSISDAARLYAHTQGNLLTDQDALVRGDLTGDGKANVADVSEVYAYVCGMSIQAIVDQAYALEMNTSMGYEVTLTGYVRRIQAPYDPQYDNITVELTVFDRRNKPIACYRMTGEGADKVSVGDIITVTGTLCNYMGKVEFEKGCHLDEIMY